LDEWLTALQSKDWEERFIARHALVSLGGEAVEPLRMLLQDKDAVLRQTAADLIRDIAQPGGGEVVKHCQRIRNG
jgi:HEAT repeat protein